MSTCALRPYDHAAKWTVAVITKPRCSFPFNALPYPSSMQLACWEASGVVLHVEAWLLEATLNTHGYSRVFMSVPCSIPGDSDTNAPSVASTTHPATRDQVRDDDAAVTATRGGTTSVAVNTTTVVAKARNEVRLPAQPSTNGMHQRNQRSRRHQQSSPLPHRQPLPWNRAARQQRVRAAHACRLRSRFARMCRHEPCGWHGVKEASKRCRLAGPLVPWEGGGLVAVNQRQRQQTPPPQ